MFIEGRRRKEESWDVAIGHRAPTAEQEGIVNVDPFEQVASVCCFESTTLIPPLRKPIEVKHPLQVTKLSHPS
jgi:hypothetical protein